MNAVESLSPIPINIRAAREAASLTQEDLGRIVGVRRTRIIDWEKGRHEPNRQHLAQLAATLGRTPGWFLDPHPEDKP